MSKYIDLIEKVETFYPLLFYIKNLAPTGVYHGWRGNIAIRLLAKGVLAFWENPS